MHLLWVQQMNRSTTSAEVLKLSAEVGTEAKNWAQNNFKCRKAAKARLTSY